MPWGPDTVYLNGLELFTSVVDRFPTGGWERLTPCEGWRAVDVLGHVGAATRYGVALLRGGAPAWRPADVPGDAVVGDPAEWWRGLVEQADRLVREADLSRVVDSPAGRRSVGEGLAFPAIDLFVHGWDLGRSAGIDVEIPVEVIEFSHRVLDAFPESQLRGPTVFGTEVTPPPGGTPTESFLAWTGRDPRWSAADGR